MCKDEMAPWYILSPLLLSLVVRLVLERRVALALAENLLLIASIQYAELSWVKVVVIAAIFVASAFLQTQLEYLDSAQDTYSHAAPLQCAANSRVSGCPAHTSRDQKRYLNYRTSRGAQVPNVTGNSQAEKTFHGRAAMFPCDLRHLRRSGFKDNYHHSYLYVGYPVGLRACYSPLITVEPPFRPGFLLPIKKAWFSIRPEDHAFNGGANLSMTEKLEEFLLSEVRLWRKWIKITD